MCQESKTNVWENYTMKATVNFAIFEENVNDLEYFTDRP